MPEGCGLVSRFSRFAFLRTSQERYGSSAESGYSHHSSGVESGFGSTMMQSTGHTGGRHFPQPEHNSGTMMTSRPWLKMAPNWGGQCRKQVSQLMQVAMSIRNAGFSHLSLRTRSRTRSTRVVPRGSFILMARTVVGPRASGLIPTHPRRSTHSDARADELALTAAQRVPDPSREAWSRTFARTCSVGVWHSTRF